ncbi:DUF4124 domain-containing protein [Methylogaea oryzae]|uniref:DUF4124 domain-containing protein n=2 Tax=Methylogaea oryzae TaxID=1295382 RepID=A0A8D5AFN8_9GAMM|nr:DUF4124 domain-containing protein [Methylogaea oryzae]BBL69508.1 hypothetical protein MoryE10_01140 [Methylogaea oryzae]
MNKRTAILAALLLSATASASDVYRCQRDGKAVYTESPKNGDKCSLLELQNTEPSAEELARQQEARQQQEAQRQSEAQKELEERKVRAEEDAARAAERQARAAEAQARYQREMLEAQEREEGDGAYYYYPRAIYYSPALQQRQTRTTESGNVDVRIGIGHSAPALGNAPRNTGNATPSITPGPSR